MKVTKDKWIWMPHPAHFICSKDCRFFLATRVGKYIVSTVGEYWPDRQVREIHASIYNPDWHSKNKNLKGDDYDYAYMKMFGFADIGFNRKFETMVGHAVKSKNKCCPYTMIDYDLDFKEYETAEEAYKGHMKMCIKYASK